MRGHGEGTILRRRTRRKDGSIRERWVARITLPGGRSQSEWCATEKEAQRALERMVELHRAGSAADARLTLGAFLRRWASSLDMAPQTMEQHRSIITNHLVPNLGDVRLDRLTPSMVDRYLTRTDLHAQTLRHHRATLRRALADALRDGLVTRNVAALSRAPRLERVERSWLDAEQAMALIEGTRGERIHAPLTVALCTGLRQAELLALSWRDVDWQARTVTVRHTLQRIDGEWKRLRPKTEKSRRVVDLVDLAVDTLRERQREQDADRGASSLDALVFTTPSGHPIHGPNLLPPLYEALERLGLPRVPWHGLRHSTASILLAAGVPLEVISRILGHSTTRVTSEIYAHLSPRTRRDAADRLQDALSGASGVRTGVRQERPA